MSTCKTRTRVLVAHVDTQGSFKTSKDIAAPYADMYAAVSLRVVCSERGRLTSVRSVNQSINKSYHFLKMAEVIQTTARFTSDRLDGVRSISPVRLHLREIKLNFFCLAQTKFCTN